MKNQYFGDTRDLFKYDLVLELLGKTDLDRFTFVPMLTEDDDTGHGGMVDHSRALAGRDNSELVDFLARCIAEGRRDIEETRGIFRLPRCSKFELWLYGAPFLDETRFQYFQGIPAESLQGAVVVLDPDIGLWVRSSRTAGDKYLRYDEARHVFEIMDRKSVLVIFQYIPRVSRTDFFIDKSRMLKEWVTDGRPPFWVSDNQVAFFVLTNDNDRFKEVRKVLAEYSDWYGLIFGEV